ncbi:MAG: Flagellar hook-associated protein 3, partial [uncultured bacterium]
GTGNSDTLKSGTGEDIFDVIDDIQTAVASGSPTDMATHLDRLDNSLEQLVSGRTKIGNRLQQMDIVESQIGDDNIKFISNLSEIQDAEIDQILTQLQMRETAMKVVFASSSQILSATANLQLNV